MATPRGLWRLLVEHRELIATALMSVSATVTAWCAFEATVWGGQQSISFAKASAARTESMRNEVVDYQLVQVDVGTFLAWVEAVYRENEETLAGKAPYQPDQSKHSGFLFERMRPDFRSAVDAWLTQRPLLNPDAPPTPFGMDAYQRPRGEKASALMVDAERDIEAGLADNHRANAYMLVTVLSSMVIFCAGLSTNLSQASNGMILLILACAAFAACVVALTRLPIAFP